MISPEDIQQIVAAIMQTEQMQWVSQNMTQGPEGAAPQDGQVPPEPGAAAPPPAAAPPKAAPPPKPAPTAESEGPPMDDVEKKHYECMSPKMKEGYSAFRKQHYAAEGSVIDDKVMREDHEGSVAGAMEKHSRNAEEVARYRRLEDEVKVLRTEQEKLKRERDAQAFKARTAERYSRLQARSREYAFDLDDEWQRISDFGDREFDAYVDGTIVQHFSRIPLGVSLPADEVVGLPDPARPSRQSVDKYSRQQSIKARDMAISRGITFEQAWDEVNKESNNGAAVK